MTGFMASLHAAQVAQNAYVAALPLWVRLWMDWMLAVLALGSLVFAIFKVEARWLLLAFSLTLVATMTLGMTMGWNKLWGTTHLVFWTPAVVYFFRRLPHIDTKTIYGLWFVVALATMLVSLVFDAKDTVLYFMGA